MRAVYTFKLERAVKCLIHLRLVIIACLHLFRVCVKIYLCEADRLSSDELHTSS